MAQFIDEWERFSTVDDCWDDESLCQEVLRELPCCVFTEDNLIDEWDYIMEDTKIWDNKITFVLAMDTLKN